MDIAYVTTRLVDRDAQGNFTEAALVALKERSCGRITLYTFAYERPPIDGIALRFLGGENKHTIGTNIRAFLMTFGNAKELASYDRLILAGPDIGVLPAVHLAKRRNPDLKLIWVYHGITPPEYLASLKDRLLTRIRRISYVRSMKRSDRIKTDSQHSKKELVGWGVDPAKVTVIPIGIDLSRFSPGTVSRIDDRFRLLYVGRLASGKRVDNLIRAMALMNGEPIALTIVGGGPERERLEALSVELGVADIVKFAGRVSDDELPGYYRACDAWVTASEHEGFCVPIVEAMAAGKPVIVPDVAAMPETSGDAGITYHTQDLDELTRSVMSLIKEKELYQSLSARATHMASSYDINRVMDGYVDFILTAGNAES
jgi:Glycosyltransferase